MLFRSTERNAARIRELGNITPLISLDGFQANNDKRRGEGVFKAADEGLARQIRETGETAVYAGRAVAALAADPGVMAKSGQVLLVGELAREYGFTDVDGSVPPPPSRT